VGLGVAATYPGYCYPYYSSGYGWYGYPGYAYSYPTYAYSYPTYAYSYAPVTYTYAQPTYAYQPAQTYSVAPTAVVAASGPAGFKQPGLHVFSRAASHQPTARWHLDSGSEPVSIHASIEPTRPDRHGHPARWTNAGLRG